MVIKPLPRGFKKIDKKEAFHITYEISKICVGLNYGRIPPRTHQIPKKEKN